MESSVREELLINGITCEGGVSYDHMLLSRDTIDDVVGWRVASPQKYVQVLNSRTYESDLIWKKWISR